MVHGGGSSDHSSASGVGMSHVIAAKRVRGNLHSVLDKEQGEKGQLHSAPERAHLDLRLPHPHTPFRGSLFTWASSPRLRRPSRLASITLGPGDTRTLLT